MSAFTSIESTSVEGPGEYRQLQKATAHHTMFVFVDGSPTSVLVVLEGSHDGFRWMSIGSQQAAEDGIRTTPATTHLVTYIRARLVLIQGDPDAKVSVSIASADDA